MPTWSSEQYLKFQKERTQPSIDLCKRIQSENPKRIVDIGCGPGNSTAVLYSRFPGSDILGVDNSQNMLDKAKKDHPQLDFAFFDASGDAYDSIGKFDVVFSNACIQWVPDHPVLLKKLMSLLNEGGELAIQVPINFREPIHQIIGEVSRSSRWHDQLSGSRNFHTLTPEEYYDVLSEISGDFTMWETVYFHRMGSHDDIMEWYKGTGLRPYLQKLNEEDGKEFQQQVYEEVVKAYPKQKNGEIIFRFPRLFFLAKK